VTFAPTAGEVFDAVTAGAVNCNAHQLVRPNSAGLVPHAAADLSMAQKKYRYF